VVRAHPTVPALPLRERPSHPQPHWVQVLFSGHVDAGRDVVGRAGCWKRLDHSSEVGRRPATNSAKLPAIRDTFPAVST
jgi:hypothetical protein